MRRPLVHLTPILSICILLCGLTPSSSTLAGPLSLDGPSASASAKGITMSMHVGPTGPYFLSELIAVDVSLTNHTGSHVQLNGKPTPRGTQTCFPSALDVEMIGGGPPTYDLPSNADMSCPAPHNTTDVAPGSTVTIRQIFPLTSSGHIQLFEHARFVSGSKGSMGQKVITSTADPLDGARPEISLTVEPRIPASRTLSLQGVWFSVSVQGPANALSHVFYHYTVWCDSAGWTSNFIWENATDGVIHLPPCFGTNAGWQLDVAAIGYAVVSATYH